MLVFRISIFNILLVFDNAKYYMCFVLINLSLPPFLFAVFVCEYAFLLASREVLQ